MDRQQLYNQISLKYADGGSAVELQNELLDNGFDFDEIIEFSMNFQETFYGA